MSDLEPLARIRGLAIPPAWADAWICADPAGHLQAAGTDAAGRRQYNTCITRSGGASATRGKFERIESFAERLPTLRRRVSADLDARS